MPSLASNPTHRLHLFWEQHCRLLPEVLGLTAKQVAKWTVEEVSYLFHPPGMQECQSTLPLECLLGDILISFPLLGSALLFPVCVPQLTQLEVRPKTLYHEGERTPVNPLVSTAYCPQKDSLPLFIYALISQS